jgi:hypothetical protein
MTTTNTAELLAFARGIIADPDPNEGNPLFDEFQCNAKDGAGEIADPDAFDPWMQ